MKSSILSYARIHNILKLLLGKMLAETEWKLNHRPVSHSVTGRLWKSVNIFLILVFEVLHF